MELQGSLYINLYSTEYQALSADDNFVYNSLATAQNKIAYFHKKKRALPSTFNNSWQQLMGPPTKIISLILVKQ
jgi:hypothetical protein